MVSIIIPTYNRAELINRAVKSVINQTYKDIEIIIVDDGSTDNTHEVLKEYISEKRIIYIKKVNGGCASARNQGVEAAKGKYMAFLDSDDTYKPDAIQNLTETLKKSRSDFVFSPVIEVFPDKRETINYPIAKNKPENFATEHLVNTNVYIHACLFKKEIFEIEKMDESMRFNEDSDFLQRVAINYRAAYCDAPTVNHYHHSKNKSKNRIEILKALLRSLDKIKTDYPNFYHSNKEAADKRFDLLRKLLLKQYVLSRDFERAKMYSHEYKADIFIRLSILFKSSIPVKLGNKFIVKL